MLDGTASISGMNKISRTLTASLAGATTGTGAFNYQWKAGGVNVGADLSTYTIVFTFVESSLFL